MKSNGSSEIVSIKVNGDQICCCSGILQLGFAVAMKTFCSVYNCRGDPFEVDPLPKSFYYPSMQRELSEAERKVRLRRQCARPPDTYQPGVLNRWLKLIIVTDIISKIDGNKLIIDCRLPQFIDKNRYSHSNPGDCCRFSSIFIYHKSANLERGYFHFH